MPQDEISESVWNYKVYGSRGDSIHDSGKQLETSQENFVDCAPKDGGQLTVVIVVVLHDYGYISDFIFQRKKQYLMYLNFLLIKMNIDRKQWANHGRMLCATKGKLYF